MSNIWSELFFIFNLFYSRYTCPGLHIIPLKDTDKCCNGSTLLSNPPTLNFFYLTYDQTAESNRENVI